MLPQRLRFALAIFFGPLLIISQMTSVQAEPAAGRCLTIFSQPVSGEEAITALGANGGYVASLNSLTLAELNSLLIQNPTFHLDICGNGFYADSMMVPGRSAMPAIGAFLPSTLPTSSAVKANSRAADYNSVFRLHSNPGSSKTIYLDFDGERIENTAWNKNFNAGAAWTAPGFSQDADFANFSHSELEVIQSVWQRVAEDYAPFDIDVTTENPPTGSLERTNAADQIYGTRALISNDTVIFNSCKCSGLAYVGAFDSIGNLHDVNQPAWIFTQGLGDNPKYLAEAVTHEVGHTLGLSHDGTNSISYYPGQNGWAPIMGVGFYQPVTQWSKGDYLQASNNEDDLAVVRSHGVELRADEDDNSEKSARALAQNQSLGGVISSASDKDYFSFTPAATSEFIVEASTATLSPNLDVTVMIYRAGNQATARSFNTPLVISSTDIADGLSVRFSQTLQAGTKYIVVVDGGGVSTPSIPYSSYGSIGTYKIGITKGGAAQLAPVVTQAAVSDNTLPSKLVLPSQTNTSPLALELPSLRKKLLWLESKILSWRFSIPE